MEKKYLVSEDEFSGQVVIVCKQYERETDVYVATEEEKMASMQLGREIPKEMKMVTFYEVKAFYHYEQNKGKGHCLFEGTTTSKEKANELFKQALVLTR